MTQNNETQENVQVENTEPQLSTAEQATEPTEKTETIEPNNANRNLTQSDVTKIKDTLDAIVQGITNFQQDNASRNMYLHDVFANYNTDEYLKNESFKNLYTEAFNLLGTKLDTPKFINLIDKYVESRIDMNAKSLAAKKENERKTDGMAFDTGVSKKSEKLPSLSEIPDDKLGEYIERFV